MTWRNDWQMEQYRHHRKELRNEMIMTSARAAALILVWAVIAGLALGVAGGVALVTLNAVAG